MLGNIVQIVNKVGQVVASYEYNAWGKILSIKNYYGSQVTDPNQIALVNPFRYRGYVYDDETGLYYLQSRYYDPVTCRFLNADVYCDTESGSPLSTNMFAYCESNPIYRMDSKGLDWYYDEYDYNVFLSNLKKNCDDLYAKSIINRIYVHAYGYASSNYISTSNRFEKIKKRYIANLALFNNYKSITKRYNDYIFGQGNGIIRNLALGEYSTVYKAGCGPVALFNVLHILGGRPNLAKVILEIELNNMLSANGTYGMYDAKIRDFLMAHATTPLIVNSYEAYKQNAKNYSIALLFVRTNKWLCNHFFCVVKIKGKYYSINRYNNDNSLKEIDIKKISGFIKAYLISNLG